ncbi:MAG: DUF4407 domain-containing protein [Bacteroidota bacterium]
MDKIKSFFWYCSGVDTRLLHNCPTDSSKYVGIGATIFFTGLFAALAAGYALYTVFDSAFIAVSAALLWGLMIFNLDRYIVSSMRKSESRWNEFFTAVPRLVLAILISLVIAKPLELKVFEKEVNSELLVMKQQETARLENEVKSKYEVTRDQLKSEIKDLKDEINSATLKRDDLFEIARMEADGTGGTMKRNAGPIYRIKKADADQAQLELEVIKKKNSTLIDERYAQLQALDVQMQNELESLEEVKLGGLASRLDALDRLTDSSEAIWLANIFIILLFVTVETTPIFVKLISTKGPYDYLIETSEYKFEAESNSDKAYIHHQLKKRAIRYNQREKDFVSNKLDTKLDTF